ncbi:MAG: encapsulin [Planctomycetes bacterium]|nr:encapsulin [Planctomycetota bacterium]
MSKQQIEMTPGDQFVQGLSGPGLAAVLTYMDSQKRREHYQEALNAAQEKKMGGMAAHLFAKYHSSVFNSLTPSFGPRSNAILPEDSWRLLTDEIVQVARRRLNGVADLVSRGLTSDAGDLGTFVVNWQTVTDQVAASVSMDGRTQQAHDQQVNTLKGAPVPVIHKDFEFDLRSILAARRAGVPLDTSHGVRAGRLVADKEEDMLMNGATSIQWGGFKIDGYTSHDDRLTETTSKDFGTLANVYAKVLLVIDKLNINNHFGPFLVYISTTQFNEAQEIHTDGSGQRGIDRILKIGGVEDVRSSAFLTDELVAVEMLSDVIDLAIAEDLRTVQWDNPGGMSTGMRVFSAKVPRIKDPKGICHGTNI